MSAPKELTQGSGNFLGAERVNGLHSKAQERSYWGLG